MAAQYTEGICGDGAAILKDGIPVSISEILQALTKADKWDELEEKISAMYEESADNDDDEGDGLLTIGEAAAEAFGYL